ncbi:aldo/keto reductase [Rhizobium sp. TRM95796]|uniref:aldo/keto reductase n=1 Tax=Rhizobium sp. TRM95796 TaxID=2979862 RepID=UPI0021E77F0A|nr:aldo/keto reductase [Rhizobium sp. TRM95796]MCV3764515.1 aldo/keto reductase [Rhizobium sp. TRM95796]
MKTTTLGKTGPQTSVVGLGCMGMSGMYGPADRAESIATLHAALDAGVTLLDTGDFYGMGHNEMLLGEGLANVPRDKYLLSVKFGAMRAPNGAWLGYDARPKAVKSALAYTLQRLRVDYIDVYRPSRLDPDVPIEDTIGAIADMVKEGYVRHIGLSEVGSDTIRRAASVHPISDLQIEYSLMSRGIEADILPTTRELGISVTAYGVLSRGLLSGSFNTGAIAASDFRAHSPRFQGENAERNMALAKALQEVATERGMSATQAAIAWVVAQGEDIVPLIGARKRTQLSESLGALNKTLTAEDIAHIEAAVPADAVAGTRYAEQMMAHLDSEKRG